MTDDERRPVTRPNASPRAPTDPDAEAGGVQPPGNPDPEARLYSTVPLEDEDGNEYVIEQQAVGREREVGGGEWPDPDTPPRAPAPGSAAPRERPRDS